MSSSQPTGQLTRQLGEFAAKIPGAVAQRIKAAADETTAPEAAPGLTVGKLAPHFALPNATDDLVELAQRLEHGAVVVSFYRGEWCPFCDPELRALQAALPRFEAHGASLIAISPQTPGHSLSATEKNGLTFDVLSDVHQDVIAAYRVQFSAPADLKQLHLEDFHNDLLTHTAHRSWDLPLPATFVIDRAQRVRAGYVSADYTISMDPDDIEAALAAID